MYQIQGGEPPSTLQSDLIKNDEVMFAGKKVIEPKRNTMQIKMKDLKTVSQDLETLMVGELKTTESKSSMGCFIVDLLRGDAKAAATKPVSSALPQARPRHQVSKSIDVSSLVAMTKKITPNQVINQDSILIKHDFDAGQSKLMKNHDMTQKAQQRMQKLIAMLRNKTGADNKVVDPLSSDSLHELANENQQQSEEVAQKRIMKRIVTIDIGDEGDD